MNSILKLLLISITSVFFIGCSSGTVAKKNNTHQSYSSPNENVYDVKFIKTSGIEDTKNDDSSKPFIGRSVHLKPNGYVIDKMEKKLFIDEDLNVNIYSRNFAQGNAVYVEVLEKKNHGNLKIIEVKFNKRDVPLSEKSWGFRGFFAIHPELKPGYKRFYLKYSINGIIKDMNRSIYVKDVKYVVSMKRLNLGKFSNRNYYANPKFRRLIIKSSKLKKKAFKSNTADHIGNTLSHPRDMHKITGVFWKKRIYLSYSKKGKKIKKKGRVRFHRGLDFKGKVGAPVYSVADGIVVLASKMFYEGNMIIVDHGNKIFSYYMHMSKLKVRPGQKVSAGDLIGEVGSTGMSTGPHLHLSVIMRGVQVHPLSFICLPIHK